MNLGDSEVLTVFLVVVALGYMAVDVSKAENSAGVKT